MGYPTSGYVGERPVVSRPSYVEKIEPMKDWCTIQFTLELVGQPIHSFTFEAENKVDALRLANEAIEMLSEHEERRAKDKPKEAEIKDGGGLVESPRVKVVNGPSDAGLIAGLNSRYPVE